MQQAFQNKPPKNQKQNQKRKKKKKENNNKKQNHTYLAFAGPSGIAAGRVSTINGRLEAERSSASAGPPSGGRAASLTPLSSSYSTGPRVPVQAIIRHTCPDPDLGPSSARLILP